MKQNLQTTLKHNWRTLLLLLTLITTSQGIWGGNEDIYVFFKDVNSWGSVYCYLYQNSYWDNTNGSGANKIYWCSNDNSMKFIKEDTDGKKIYGIRITGKDPSKVNYISFTRDAQCRYGNFYNTKAVYRNDTGSSFNHKMYTPPTTKNETKNGTDYFSDGSWSAWCDKLSAPATVVSGTDIMLYAYQYYDSPKSQVGITKNTSTCIGTATEITSGDKKHSIIQVASSEFSTPFQIHVSNNCNDWQGESCDDWKNQSALDAQGSYYKHESSGKSKVAATTATVSLSSSSITEGTESIDITIVGSSTNSSYDKMLYAIIYVDDSKDACKALATSPGSVYTLNTSSLTVGDHTIKTILTDGTIYYIGDKKTLTVTPACTAPTVTTVSGASNVTSSAARLTGNISSVGDCGSPVVGIAYGTNSSPTTLAPYSGSLSTGDFTVDISGLTAETKYYYRAYSKSSSSDDPVYDENVYSFYTNPTDLYIKGPLVNNDSWGSYTKEGVGYTHTAGTNSFSYSFNARTGGGGYSDYREFCISTTEGEGGKIQSSMDGTTSGWSFKNGSGTNFVASSTIVSTDNTAIDITITYNNSTGKYHMVLAGACGGVPTIDSDLSSSTTWSKCGNADGRLLSITASGGSGTLTYQWFRNTTNTLTDGVADLTSATAVTDMVEGGNTYSPSASDYGKFYYCCVVRSGGACSANKATSVYTGEIEIKQTPTVKPSTIAVKQYEPVRLQATNSSVNWSITAYPGGAAADEYYLYDDTKSSAMFKGKTGSYTITATSTGSDCTSTSTITVNNDDSEGC
jgi:hypothetical protein